MKAKFARRIAGIPLGILLALMVFCIALAAWYFLSTQVIAGTVPEGVSGYWVTWTCTITSGGGSVDTCTGAGSDGYLDMTFSGVDPDTIIEASASFHNDSDRSICIVTPIDTSEIPVYMDLAMTQNGGTIAAGATSGSPFKFEYSFAGVTGGEAPSFTHDYQFTDGGCP